MIWHCRCDCGNEIDVLYNSLVYTGLQSCGCRKRERDQQLQSLLTRVDGTSMDMIRSKKVPSDNTSGYRGVYRYRGKYVAKIVFQKKAYYLGNYFRIEDAVQARREAEELLFDGSAAFYDKWKERAAADPKWAEENPVEIRVTQDSEKGLQVEFLPVL